MIIVERELLAPHEIEANLKFFSSYSKSESKQPFEGAISGLWNEMTRNVAYSHIHIHLLNAIYSLWKQPEICPEYSDKLSSYDGFVSYSSSIIGHTPSKRVIGRLSKHFNLFMQEVVHPKRIYTVTTQEEWRTCDFDYSQGIYMHEGDWSVYEIKPVGNHIWATYVERSVLKEVEAVTSAGINVSPDYVHTTSSTSMPGIARHTAILSAREALQRGEIVTAGEDFRYRPSHPPHDRIFASKGAPIMEYATTPWFNEHGISFGISRHLLLEHVGFDPVYDGKSEGMMLGEEVPLSAVPIVFYPKVNEVRTLDWMKTNIPEAKGVSYEAAEIIRKEQNNSQVLRQL